MNVSVWLRTTVHLVLAATLLASGFGKATHMERFVGILERMPYVQHPVIVGLAVCGVELTLGCLLLLGRWRRRVLEIVFILFSAFTLFTVATAGTLKDCGCFTGVAQSVPLFLHLLFLGAILAASAWLLRSDTLSDWTSAVTPLGAVASMICSLVLAGGVLLGIRSAHLAYVQRRDPQVGQELALRQWLPAEALSSNATLGEQGLIVFGRADCPYCIATLPRLREPIAKMRLRGLPIIFVTVPDHGDFRTALQNAHVDAAVFETTDQVLSRQLHVNRTPTFVWYNKGRVSRVAVGEDGDRKVAAAADIEGTR